MGMCFKKYAAIKREKLILKKKKYGIFLFRLSEDSKLFMIGKYCTEI